MDCPVCSTLPVAVVRELDQQLRTGTSTMTDLAVQYGVAPEALHHHDQNCRDVPVDGHEQLAGINRRLNSMADALRQQIDNGDHMRVEEGYDGRGLVGNYVTVSREIRENIMALQRLTSATEIAGNFNEVVVSPMIMQATTIVIEEMGRLQNALLQIVKPDRYHRRIASAFDEASVRAGQRLKDEVVRNLDEKVKAALK